MAITMTLPFRDSSMASSACFGGRDSLGGTFQDGDRRPDDFLFVDPGLDIVIHEAARPAILSTASDTEAVETFMNPSMMACEYIFFSV